MTRARGRAMSDSKEVGFYNPHDGLKGRDGGPYLDHINRQTAEINRALVEGRDADDLNGVLPADAGTPLVTAAQVIDNSPMSNPSMVSRPGVEAVFDDASFKDKRNGEPYGEADTVSIASPVSTLEIDTRDSVDEDAAHPNVTDVAPEPEQTVVDSSGGTTTVSNDNDNDSNTAPPPPPVQE